MKPFQILIAVLSTSLIYSCNTASSDVINEDKEKELLKKELELTKRELELNKIENEQNKEQPKAQPAENKEIDDFQSDPVKVVQRVFDASRNMEARELAQLCDPIGPVDRDVRMICELINLPEEKQEAAMGELMMGSVNGPAEIDGNTAKVKVKIGPNGEYDREFKLVKVGLKWYLSHI